jgi:hypothetical protein
MTEAVEEIARALGARIVGEVPAPHGAFGAAHLARVYQERMEERRREESPGQPPMRLLEIPISEAAAQRLEQLTRWLSDPEHPYRLEDIAAGLLGFGLTHWLERARQLQTSEDEARAKYLELKKAREEAERVLQGALRDLSRVAEKQSTG